MLSPSDGAPVGDDPYVVPPLPAASSPQISPQEERTWAVVAHLGGFLLGWVVPLIVRHVHQGRSPYLDNQGREALNFQVTLAITYVCGIGAVLVGIWSGFWAGIGLFVLGLAFTCAIAFAVHATVTCARHGWYRYPVRTVQIIR